MSVPPEKTASADRLAEAVLAQANEEAKRIREAAAAEASRLIADAEAKAAERREAVATADRAEALRSQVAARVLARLDARRELLEARERLIERVFELGAEALESLRTRTEYGSVLARLVREGIEELGGESFVLEVPPEDVPVANEIAVSMTTPKRAIDARASEGLGGGSIVWRKDGRAFCDKTFAGLLSRNRPRLRALVAEWLWGDSAEAISEFGRVSSE